MEPGAFQVCDPKWTQGKTGLCLESHDLAASKLAAYREKDLVFVATLLTEGLIEVGVLTERVRALPIDDEARLRLLRWVDAMARSMELGAPGPP